MAVSVVRGRVAFASFKGYRDIQTCLRCRPKIFWWCGSTCAATSLQVAQIGSNRFMRTKRMAALVLGAVVPLLVSALVKEGG